ncbi:ATP-binding protein [Mesorhizobium sp. B2-3-5]|uniref:ATP-binding protein n=1 Tax=Mesorhizobium sp. B2-3-5 TaxID=2589958 RepID=UPI00112D7205|nr:ATP-binding protein [Mesorhizobium sp. B2-3-5]TPM26924.1 two-component sensor histidine kinase [Mesorhizobium sp. B2-3-5]
MKRSMRARLFLILMVATGMVWFSAVVWISLRTRAEVESALDSRLVEAANMVSSLIDKQDIDAARAAAAPGYSDARRRASYERQLSCQIWSFNGDLLSRSEGAPQGELSDVRAGFSQTEIDGERWRVYAVENKELGVRVLVGDNLHARDGLVNDVITGLLLPALLMVPALAGLIWLSVGSGLAPLRRMAERLGARTASDLNALPDGDATVETAPVIRALNALFERVAAARDRERNFTAFAAHELRTPLAGLKTQAQVAIASGDSKIREKALHQIVQGVTRTARLVRQLLDMASVEASAEVAASGRFVPGDLLAVLRDELRTLTTSSEPLSADLPNGSEGDVGESDALIPATVLTLPDKQGPIIIIADELFRVEVDMNADLFTLAARNLLENAILHAGQTTTITCSLIEKADTVEIAIDDEGPGIPAGEIAHVTERFFRGRHKTTVGSGLGLSIAEFAVEHGRAKLALHSREPGGLSARMVFDRCDVSWKSELAESA